MSFQEISCWNCITTVKRNLIENNSNRLQLLFASVVVLASQNNSVCDAQVVIYTYILSVLHTFTLHRYTISTQCKRTNYICIRQLLNTIQYLLHIGHTVLRKMYTYSACIQFMDTCTYTYMYPYLSPCTVSTLRPNMYLILYPQCRYMVGMYHIQYIYYFIDHEHRRVCKRNKPYIYIYIYVWTILSVDGVWSSIHSTI